VKERTSNAMSISRIDEIPAPSAARERSLLGTTCDGNRFSRVGLPHQLWCQEGVTDDTFYLTVGPKIFAFVLLEWIPIYLLRSKVSTSVSLLIPFQISISSYDHSPSLTHENAGVEQRARSDAARHSKPLPFRRCFLLAFCHYTILATWARGTGYKSHL